MNRKKRKGIQEESLGESWNAMTAVLIDNQGIGNGREPRQKARTFSQRFCSEKLNSFSA